MEECMWTDLVSVFANETSTCSPYFAFLLSFCYFSQTSFLFVSFFVMIKKHVYMILQADSIDFHAYWVIQVWVWILVTARHTYSKQPYEFPEIINGSIVIHARIDVTFIQNRSTCELCVTVHLNERQAHTNSFQRLIFDGFQTQEDKTITKRQQQKTSDWNWNSNNVTRYDAHNGNKFLSTSWQISLYHVISTVSISWSLALALALPLSIALSLTLRSLSLSLSPLQT